jgi:predicted metal-binding protein
VNLLDRDLYHEEDIRVIGEICGRLCDNTPPMLDHRDLIKIALEAKATDAAILDTSVIQFHEDFRKACEKNVCRKYDTTWMGPPAIGPIRELKKRALSYRHGLLFQTVHPLKSNFDIKGMFAAAGVHENIFKGLVEKIRSTYPLEAFLPLSAGCCSVCEKCAYLEKEPCRFPDQAVASVEAYGMNVIALQKSAGLPYNNGKSFVTYVGLILFDRAEEKGFRSE